MDTSDKGAKPKQQPEQAWMDLHEPRFFIAGGTLAPDAASYLRRAADDELFETLMEGQYAYMLDSRQKGKSSLVARTQIRLEAAGVKTIKIDLQSIGSNLNVEQWYASLVRLFGRQLGLEREAFECWGENHQIGPFGRWLSVIEQVVLPKTSVPLVVFVDEVDFVRSLPFSADEFFAGIRECYNRRSRDESFTRLTFCLIGSATPSQLVQNVAITPFNIGREVKLSDFSRSELNPFAKALKGSRNGESLLDRVYFWTKGHPYLTQAICAQIAEDVSASGPFQVDRIVERTYLSTEARQREPNLLDVSRRLLETQVEYLSPDESRGQLLNAYGQVLNGKKLLIDDSEWRLAALRLSGAVSEQNGTLVVRNEIYRRAFSKVWIRANMPDAEVRRQQSAARRAILRTAGIASLIVLTVSGSTFGMWRLASERQQALSELGLRTTDLAKTSEDRKRALAMLEGRNQDLSLVSGEREKALDSLKERTEDLERVTANQRDTLNKLSQTNTRLEATAREKGKALVDLKKSAEALQRQNYAFLVNLLAGSIDRRTSEMFYRAEASPYRGWEWGHLKKHFEKPILETQFSQFGTFETHPDGKLMAVTGHGIFDIGVKGASLRIPFKEKLATEASGALLPGARRGSFRIWGSAASYTVLDAETNQIVVPSVGDWIMDIDPKRRTYLVESKSAPGLIEVRSLNDHKVIGSHKGLSSTQDARCLADGSMLSAHGDGEYSLEVHRWSLTGATKVVRPALRRFRLLELSPDGSKYAVCEDRRAEIRRTSDDALLGVTPELPDFIQALSFGADASMFLIGCMDGGVRLYDAKTAELQRTFLDKWVIFDVAFLPGGRHIASIGENLKIWSLESPPAMETLREGVSRMAFLSGDAKHLISQSADGSISSRNRATGKVTRRAPEPSGESALLARSEVSDHVFIGLPDGGVAKLRCDGLKEEWKGSIFPSGKVLLKVLPGDKRLLSGVVNKSSDSMECALIDAQSMAVESRFRLKAMDEKLFFTNSLNSYSRNGNYFAVGESPGKDVRIYSARDGSLIRGIETDLQSFAIALSPDGTTIAISVGKNWGSVGRIDCFDVRSGRKLGSLTASDERTIGWLDYSPNGEFLAGLSSNSSGYLWDLRRQCLAATFPKALGSHFIRFSQDGERIVASGPFQMLGVWDGRTGASLMTLKYAAFGRIMAGSLRSDNARFTPDGRHIVALCNDGAVRIWNSLPWKEEWKTDHIKSR